MLEQALISFFEQAARRNETLLNKLRQEPRFTVEPGRWCFTLPDLHSFLQEQDAEFRSLDYRRFRKALFNSPINETAKSCGAEITIVDNQGKVDRSRYALVWKAGVK
ncbi:hypothetical protein SVA_2671 [Sulfurifustis variabilis]|uniref:Uncharacterized protein n=1 Tax=Sulfurifustis variabilis TaxID=1675686 RepID=A0A1B4V6P8_9GAMM|nr:hypothetical protein [Sulfurifustis variabilis]BAU49219.1 hypothetical protein SVA_2671 [Sulfurifustis variabilis]